MRTGVTPGLRSAKTSPCGRGVDCPYLSLFFLAMSSTVILGTGVIGLSTALHLADHQPPSSIHLVEPAPGLFSSASGYAGGFLAKDWFSDKSASLGALSFELHRRLAEQHNGREMGVLDDDISHTYSCQVPGQQAERDDWLRDGTSRAQAAPPVADDPAALTPGWLRSVSGDLLEMNSEEDTTAIVDPLRLCQFLLERCLSLGVHLHHPAAALTVNADVRGELASIRIADLRTSTETDLPCTRLIITSGAWSPHVFQSLFKHSALAIPIASLAGHSLVLKSPRWHQAPEGRGCHAVYSRMDDFSPEVYARLGGHLYIAGVNSLEIPLPKVAGKSAIIPQQMALLKGAVTALLGSEAGDDDLEIVREGLCFRPITPWGDPIISRISDEHLGVGIATRPGADGGVFIAAGHGPWGISHSLGTGMVLAELAQGRPLSADISALGFRP